VWARVLAVLQREADVGGRLDWDTHYVDGTVVRAHARGVAQHAAGARGGQADEALGRSRGGFSTKVHVRAEGGGQLLAVVVSGGERHARASPAALRRGITGARARPARRARAAARAPAAARGRQGLELPHGAPAARAARHPRGDPAPERPAARRPPTPPIRPRRLPRPHRVERLINRLKQYRRIATRYEKHAAHYLALLTLAAGLLWL
jgi:transposase